MFFVLSYPPTKAQASKIPLTATPTLLVRKRRLNAPAKRVLVDFCEGHVELIGPSGITFAIGGVQLYFPIVVLSIYVCLL